MSPSLRYSIFVTTEFFFGFWQHRHIQMPAVQIMRPRKPRMAGNWEYQGCSDCHQIESSELKWLGMRVIFPV